MDALAVAEGNESLVSIGRGRGLALCTKPPLQLLRCHLRQVSLHQPVSGHNAAVRSIAVVPAIASGPY